MSNSVSFMGMISFMKPLILYMLHHTGPIKELIKKNNMFAWDAVVSQAFQKLKVLMVTVFHKPL